MPLFPAHIARYRRHHQLKSSAAATPCCQLRTALHKLEGFLLSNHPARTLSIFTGNVRNTPDGVLPPLSVRHQFYRSDRDLSLVETAAWHAHLGKTPLLSLDLSAADFLAHSYCKNKAFDYALDLLDQVSHSNPILWNAVLSGYNRECQFDSSLNAFCRMRVAGVKPTEFTYGSLLSASTSSGDLWCGRQIHSLVVKDRFIWDAYVSTGLVDFYAKNGTFNDALRLFKEIMNVSNVVCWNAVIAGGVRNGEHWVALDIFQEMVSGHCTPNGFTFSSVLTACVSTGDEEMGRGIHGWVVKCGMEDDIFVGTGIVDLYGKFGYAEDALKQFSLMQVHNVVSWTAIISGLVQSKEYYHALHLFNEMRRMLVEINKYTVTSALAACGEPGMACETLQIHCLVVKNGFSKDGSINDALIVAYGRFGDSQMSEKVFEEMGSDVSMGSWAALISSLVQSMDNRSIEFFLKLYREGCKPDEFCTTSILSIINSVELGKQIHSYLIKSSLISVVSVGCALLSMYSRCGNLAYSCDIFKEMPVRDKITWTSTIAGLADHGCSDKALQLFIEMINEEIKPDQMTLAAILTACASQKYLIKGKEIHGHIFRAGLFLDTFVGGALINMYSRCCVLRYAARTFNLIPHKDQFLWSSLVSGHAQNGYSTEALYGFCLMMSAGFIIDQFTVSSALGACTNISNAALASQIHAYVVKSGVCFYLPVNSALVTMYSKCGNIIDSYRAFDEIVQPDLVTWTAIIDGYAQHGKGEEALKLFQEMLQCGTIPDSVTFVSVLSACSRNGLVEEGLFHFNSMFSKYGIKTEICHYACVIDLLCRSGKLIDAANFISRMPIEPNTLIWTTFLSACRLHGKLELGKKTAEKVVQLGTRDSGVYISLSNFYAELGDWGEVLNIRKSMKEYGTRKEPGWTTMKYTS